MESVSRSAGTAWRREVQRNVGAPGVQAKISQLIPKVDQFLRRFTLTSRYMLSFGQAFSDLARAA